MRLTEGEILSIARERGLEWYLPDFARRIERAVLEKVIKRMDEMENEMDCRPRWIFFEKEIRTAAQKGEE